MPERRCPAGCTDGRCHAGTDAGIPDASDAGAGTSDGAVDSSLVDAADATLTDGPVAAPDGAPESAPVGADASDAMAMDATLDATVGDAATDTAAGDAHDGASVEASTDTGGPPNLARCTWIPELQRTLVSQALISTGAALAAVNETTTVLAYTNVGTPGLAKTRYRVLNPSDVTSVGVDVEMGDQLDIKGLVFGLDGTPANLLAREKRPTDQGRVQLVAWDLVQSGATNKVPVSHVGWDIMGTNVSAAAFVPMGDGTLYYGLSYTNSGEAYLTAGRYPSGGGASTIAGPLSVANDARIGHGGMWLVGTDVYAVETRASDVTTRLHRLPASGNFVPGDVVSRTLGQASRHIASTRYQSSWPTLLMDYEATSSASSTLRVGTFGAANVNTLEPAQMLPLLEYRGSDRGAPRLGVGDYVAWIPGSDGLHMTMSVPLGNGFDFLWGDVQGRVHAVHSEKSLVGAVSTPLLSGRNVVSVAISAVSIGATGAQRFQVAWMESQSSVPMSPISIYFGVLECARP